MKKYFLLLSIVLGAFCSNGQTIADQSAIVQKCLDLSELQPYYPKAADGSYEKVYIMQYPTVFPATLEVSKFGKYVPLADRREIMKENAQAYFLFQSVEMEESKAKVAFDFLFNFAKNSTWVSVTVDFQKVGNAWTVTGSKLIRK